MALDAIRKKYQAVKRKLETTAGATEKVESSAKAAEVGLADEGDGVAHGGCPARRSEEPTRSAIRPGSAAPERTQLHDRLTPQPEALRPSMSPKGLR